MFCYGAPPRLIKNEKELILKSPLKLLNPNSMNLIFGNKDFGIIC